MNIGNYIAFPLFLGLLGWIFSSRSWLIFLNNLDPPVGLGVYYLIVFITLLGLQHIGLVIADLPFNSINHAIGTILIIFSFFIVFDWTSYYVTQVTQGEDAPPPSRIYMQSEDGAVYYLWNSVVKMPIQQARAMTYVVTPVVLSVLGLVLIHGKLPRLSPI
jgi:hypothetical protein